MPAASTPFPSLPLQIKLSMKRTIPLQYTVQGNYVMLHVLQFYI